MDTLPSGFDRTLDDWQLVNTSYSYELSKYEIELIACRLNAAYRSPEQEPEEIGSGSAVSPDIRHFIVHPGVTATNVYIIIGAFLGWWARLSFYLVRH